MNSYEKNIDSFLELIIKNKLSAMKIDKTYKYKKPTYTITLPTSVDYVPDSNFGISFGKVGVYLNFTPHRNEIVLERDDCENIYIDSELLTNKYSDVIEALYHKINNDRVLNFINTSVEYLELKSVHRSIKIETLHNEKD